ncbi:MAG: ABC transporter ATP-binding protein [Pseudomonadota bacterium]|jgi:NitT/TauT family transport system ATP-binding protein|nr:ABC transporter ATP-binding protein [Pseudomonadota bacterium]
MAENAIVLQNVSKSFGDVIALDSVSFDLSRGEFVALLGPSGCGKSTLIRLIAGLYPSDPGGEIAIFGEFVTRPSRRVGVVFQTYNLLPWLSVTSNLRLAADTRGMSKEIVAERLVPMLEMLGLEQFSERYPHELSGGMRQRVALGQALLMRPDVLLLDEPFGSLDALTRDQLNVELLRLCQAHGQSVLLVTHSIDEAVLLADRVLMLSKRPGRIVEDIPINLPRPRDPRETRLLPAYASSVNQLGELMGVV